MASFLVLISLSLTVLVYNCEADLIDSICVKSVNPSLCNTTLRSDPHSGEFKIVALGQIAISNAGSATKNVLKVAKTLSSGPDKQKAETCAQACKEAVDYVDKCRYLLLFGSRKSVADIRTKALAASKDIATCDSVFRGSEPPQLKQASRQAQDLVDVIKVIADDLLVVN